VNVPVYKLIIVPPGYTIYYIDYRNSLKLSLIYIDRYYMVYQTYIVLAFTKEEKSNPIVWVISLSKGCIANQKRVYVKTEGFSIFAVVKRDTMSDTYALV
jgi:hypothetical protein